VLLSGLGFENTGVSLAHGLEAGFHVLPLPKPLLHGTGVGYSTLVELIVENKTEDFEKVFAFAKEIGLPCCTADLGLTDENRDAAVNALVDDVYAKRWQVMNVPFQYDRSTLINAIYYLDTYAAEHK
jgi:glycerol dehydrogenase